MFLVFIHMVACQQKDLIRNDNHAIMNHIQVIPIILFTIYVIIKQHSPTTGRLRQHSNRYLTKSNNQNKNKINPRVYSVSKTVSNNVSCQRFTLKVVKEYICALKWDRNSVVKRRRCKFPASTYLAFVLRLKPI